MDLIYFAVLLSLLFISVLYICKFYSYRSQIRKFTKMLRNRLEKENEEPAKTDIFDKTITDLAGVLNEHADLRQKSAEENRKYRKELTDTVSGIAHDFRTPLTASLGYIQMIKKSGELSEKNNRYLGIIEEKNRYLKKLSDDLFELPALERDDEVRVSEKINLSNLLSEKIFGMYKWINESGVKTDFRITEDIMINSDKHRIERIVSNLLSNTEKYTLSSMGVKLEKSGDEAIITIWNDTEYPEKTDMKRVFEMFYRSDNSRNGKGSGIGLCTARLLCENIGAKISAVMENDIFRVTLVLR